MEVTSEDYADSCCLYNCSSSQKTYERVDKNPCNVSIVVSERMEPPIYLYYRLSNYYQNHRRYVRSRDDLQLKGTTVAFEDLAETDSCQCACTTRARGRGRSGRLRICCPSPLLLPVVACRR